MDFDTIETGFQCCACAAAVILEDETDIVDGERARLGGFGKGAGAVIIDDIGLRLRRNGGRSNRLAAMRL